ncbi:MAG: SRPBCC family protein [Streptosporangiaceae bacterium]|jgi:carbon monoxide dehydrogenase subunit G
MPPPLEITSRVLVPAAPQQVWDLAMDWSRQGDWMPGTRVRGGAGVGAEVVAWSGIGPAGFTDSMVITEWEPPRRCVVRHTGKVVRGLGIFEVVPRGELSEFRWTELLELPVPGAAALGRWTVAPLARRGLAIALRRFAALATARS